MERLPIKHLSIRAFTKLAETKAALSLPASAARQLEKRFRAVEALAKSAPVYGVNTGIGSLCDTVLPQNRLRDLQENIVRSHACGSAPYLSERIGRGALLLSANSLSKGFSGVSGGLVKYLIRLYNAGISPLLPEQGSLGASGDLIPLAHLGLLLLGRGRALRNGKMLSAAAALKNAGLRPYRFRPKEALGLINGTEALTAVSSFSAYGAGRLWRASIAATASLFEVLGASTDCLAADIHRLKPHAGQIHAAKMLRETLAASRLCGRPRKKLQDAYVIRCSPQIDGAFFEVIEDASSAVEIELNAITDNPLFFPKGHGVVARFGGNFHAERVAFAMDSLAIAIAAFTKATERRIERLLNPEYSSLPPFLASQGGLESGLMIPQYLVASLAAENGVLASPASVHSIPVSANQEDFVSMAMTAAAKCARAVANAESALAAELLCLARAMDVMRGNGTPLGGFCSSSRALLKTTRTRVAPHAGDRELGDDIAAITELVRSGAYEPALE